jgi:outer membrane protein OmpA-like peptidoglycan-associated protein
MRLLPLIASLLLVVTVARADDTEIDLLAFSNGGLIDHTSGDYGGWTGLQLLDENPATGWANPQGTKPPFEIVVSVPEHSRFTRFGFDTASAESAERSAKEVDILVSDQSGTAGFQKVMTVTLEPAADGQNFPLATPVEGRWVKFVVRSNHGAPDYWEIMNVHGYGVALTNTPLTNVSGTYDSTAYGRFHLAQSGAQLIGCYEYNEGVVQGGLEAHLMRLTWTESGDNNTGPAVMVQTRDGKGFQGLWRRETDSPNSGWNENWVLKKISNDVGSCPHWRPPGSTAGAGGSGNLVAAGLAHTGRVRLYGITFDTDSDRPRPDATPTLDQVAAALKANPDWHVTVEGHTDSTSTPAHNLDLSARRAAAVKAYLVAAGIDAGRIATSGFGQDRPVADNGTALGRAQNRRVEIVRE